jgi:predicted dehydrogenase
MSADKVKVGIIGTGRLATYAHMPDYRKAGAEVIAVCDVVPGRAAEFAKTWEVPHAFTDCREMLKLKELQGVSVCVPPYAHEEVALAAIAAGKSLYLEKPPAMNEAQITRIVQAARQAGVLLMGGSHTVYWNETQVLKRRIDAGDLGQIYLVRNVGHRRRGIPRAWFREKRFSGGGVGMDGISHSMDRILYLLNTPKPISVIAHGYNHFAEYIPRDAYISIGVEKGTEKDIAHSDVEDTLVSFVQFDTGTTVIIVNAWAANQASGGGGTYIYGTKGGTSENPLTLYGETEDRVPTDTVLQVPDGPHSHEPALRHFTECIREHKETLSPGERSIVTMRIIDAMYKSAAEGGREVRL